LLKDQSGWNTFTIQLKPNTAYTASSNLSFEKTSELSLYFFVEGMNPGSSTLVSASHPVTVTTPESGIVSIQQRRISGTDSFQNYNWQIEEGSTASSFVPYSNICPISGWTGAKVTRTGKNLLNIDRQVGEPNPTDLSVSPRVMSDSLMYVGVSRGNYYYKGNASSYSIENGTITVNSKNNSYGLGFPVSVKPSTTYTLSATKTACLMSVGQYDAEWNFISSIFIATEFSKTFTTADNASYVVVIISSNEPNTNGTATDIQLELGFTATDYEPYQGQTYEVTFPAEAGTVYGGTLDVVRGKLVVDKHYVSLANTSNVSYHTGTVPSIWLKYESGKTGDARTSLNAISNMYPVGGNMYPRISYYGSEVDIFDSRFTDEQTARSLLSDFICVYKLASPIEYTLTTQEIKTLLGTNKIWADAGNTAVTYPADTKLYIDKKIAELQALILENNG
jgi:hypothetical protein